jgi:predicted AlkP superfamily phosphohydrolase/phosphomutase
MPKVIVLGFDAMDPALVERWVAEGHLPNIARLQREGAGGRLRSTIQPISPAAWSTAVTGMNPGQHSVFDWHERNPASYHERIVDARSIKAPTVWQRANQAGLKAGVFNVPLTFPPQPLDGWLVTGILTPPGAREITYPPGLREEIDAASDGYRVFFGVTYKEGDEQTFLDALHDTLERRRKALLHLIDHHPTDLVFAVFMESDHIMHAFWKHMDDTHPSHRPGDERHAHAIRDVYRHLDEILGDVLGRLEADSTLVLLSDHGSGPNHGFVLVNKLLMQHGLLAMRRSPLTAIKLWLARHEVATRLYALTRALGLDLRPLVPRKMRETARHGGLGMGDIDWQRTKAYVSGDFGLVSINVAGREAQGCVDPRDKEAVIDEVMALLGELRVDDGEPLVDQFWRAPALYHGPHLDHAPDLIFQMRDFRYKSSPAVGHGGTSVFEDARMGPTEISGGHALYGIFYALGPGVRAGQVVEKMDLTQVTPTVLYRLGLPVPDTLDGKVIEGLFESDYLSKHPIEIVHENESPDIEGEESVYDAEETAEIENRLRDLGYLE